MEHSKLREVLISMSLKYKGNYRKIIKGLQFKERIEYELKEDKKYNTVTVIDTHYPKTFQDEQYINPPVVLFYIGNLKLLDEDVMKVYVLEDGTRFFTAIDFLNENEGTVIDYIIACENEENVYKMYQHIMKKGLKMKEYGDDEQNDDNTDTKC